MTFGELVDKLDAWRIVIPILNEQKVYNVSITPDAKVMFSLEESSVTIDIT